MTNQYPPAIRVGFMMIQWFCSIDHLEMVEGDLLELYESRVRHKGVFNATIIFYIECANLIFRFIGKGKSEYYLNNVSMLKSYFSIGIRNLLKNRSYSIVNITGLAVGIAGAILIYQYVVFEINYDTRYSAQNKIVRISSEWYQDNEFLEHRAAAVPALGQIFDENFPEVQSYARYHKGSINVVRFIASGEREIKFEERDIYFADEDFINIFELEFLRGIPINSLDGPNKVIITKTIAQKYFGDTDPLGKTLKYDGEFDFSCIVTGVVKDFDNQSHLAGDMIISLETKASMVPFEIYNNWIWRSFYTYLTIPPDTDLQSLAQRINTVVRSKVGDYYSQRGYEVNFHVQAVDEIHLSSHLFEEIETNGSWKEVTYLSGACLLLVLIAVFNYINLTTAKNLHRAKEVGIRKVVGAYRINLMLQYLIESLLVFGVAIALSLVLIYMLCPVLASYARIDLNLTFFNRQSFWGLLLLIWLSGAVLAGLYPAFVLTSMNPTQAFRGSFRNASGNTFFRRSLIVFQIAISLGLIFSVIVITQQVRHMQGRELGVRKDNIVVINGPKIKGENYLSSLETFKQQLELEPNIQKISTVSSLVGEVTGAGRDFRNEKGLTQFIRIIRVDYDFEEVLDIPVIAGHTFSKLHPASDSGLVLNEAAIRQLGFEAPASAIQQNISWRNVQEVVQSQVVGVVKDYFPNAQSPAVPTVFILNRTYSAPWDPEFYLVSLTEADFRATNKLLNDIERFWKSTFPADPFNYYFMSSFYDTQFQSEVKFGKILSLFSFLAIILSSLGILALASFTNFMRLKEVGIRKILGSSEPQILVLILKDYIKLFLFGALLVFPVVYQIFNNWLAGFSYRIEIEAWHFMLPLGGLLILVLSIIAIQSYRTVTLNPIQVLRRD